MPPSRRHAKQEKRRLRRKLAQLTAAGILSSRDIRRTKAGALTVQTTRKVERLWDQLGPYVANPEGRPFHAYRPRSSRGRKAALALIGADAKKVKDARAIPVPVLMPGARIRHTKQGISIRYPGRREIRQRELALEAEDLLAPRRSKVVREGERARKAGAAVRLRTGPGHWSPTTNNMSVPQGISYLVGRYADHEEWLTAIEILEILE